MPHYVAESVNLPFESNDPEGGLAKRMNYLDFEIEIGVGSGREYPVVVVHSAAGEARETMHFPFDELALENRLKDLQIALLRSGGRYRQIHAPVEQAVQSFGRALFDALFTGEVHNRYSVSQLAALQQSKGLRLKLRIHTPELAALPWEFLYDAGQAEYVCLSSNTQVVRYCRRLCGVHRRRKPSCAPPVPALPGVAHHATRPTSTVPSHRSGPRRREHVPTGRETVRHRHSCRHSLARSPVPAGFPCRCADPRCGPDQQQAETAASGSVVLPPPG